MGARLQNPFFQQEGCTLGVWGGDRCPSLPGTVEVLQQVGKDPLCYYVEIYRAYNPQMNENTFQLFIPRGC